MDLSMSYLMGWGILVGITLTVLVWFFFGRIKEGFEGGGGTAIGAGGTTLDDAEIAWDKETSKQVCPYLNMVVLTAKDTLRHINLFQKENPPYAKIEETKDLVNSYLKQMRMFKCDKVGFKVAATLEEALDS
jgi:hypothetical protein